MNVFLGVSDVLVVEDTDVTIVLSKSCYVSGAIRRRIILKHYEGIYRINRVG